MKTNKILINQSKSNIVSLKVVGSFGSIEKQLSGSDFFYKENSFFFFSKSSYKSFLAHLTNWLNGVTYGYFVELSFIGLGYRFILLNNFVLLKIGYGHYIRLKVPNSMHIFGYKKRLIIFGLDLQELNLFVQELKQFRKIDRYKGKGIRLVGEVVSLKVGKQKA